MNNDESRKIYDFAENVIKREIDIKPISSDLAYLELEEEITEKRIKYIEREVRGSYEYRQYINYLKNELDLTKCALLPTIDINELDISLEFHHYPLSLYDITEAVAKKMIAELDEGSKVSCFDIAEQIMAEHYKNNIGLVPLTETLHEMAHNRSIIIPIDKVHGSYKTFITDYSDHINPDVIDRVSTLEFSSGDEDSLEYNKMKLSKNIIHYDVNYIREDDNDE